jgi:hypothetical protein
MSARTGFAQSTPTHTSAASTRANIVNLSLPHTRQPADPVDVGLAQPSHDARIVFMRRIRARRHERLFLK